MDAYQMNCSSCNKVLDRAIPSHMRRRDDFPQYEDALVIDVLGGYGMFFDNINNNRVRYILCKKCADIFVTDNIFLDWESIDNG